MMQKPWGFMRRVTCYRLSRLWPALELQYLYSWPCKVSITDDPWMLMVGDSGSTPLLSYLLLEMAIFTGAIIIWYYLTCEWMLSESYKHGVLYSLRICKWKLTLCNHQRTYFFLTLRGKKAMDYAADDTLDSEEFLQVDNLLATRCWGRCPFDIHNYLPLGVFPLLSIELIEFMIILREMLPNVKDVTHLRNLALWSIFGPWLWGLESSGYICNILIECWVGLFVTQEEIIQLIRGRHDLTETNNAQWSLITWSIPWFKFLVSGPKVSK